VKTDRLVLRPATAADHAWLLAHWTAPDVRRFLFDGAVLSPDEFEGSVREFVGLWLICAPGEPVGTIGLRPLEDLGIELTYSLEPGAWGRGYATEAGKAVLDHAFGTLGLPEVLAEIDEGNQASAAVIERLGMVAFDVVPGELGPMTRYRKAAGDEGVSRGSGRWDS
jgi:[ribosomal protein S5]-alanine N-acetyltransferase